MANELKHVKGSVITRVKMDEKDSHTFSDGTKIILERDRENFDKNIRPYLRGR